MAVLSVTKQRRFVNESLSINHASDVIPYYEKLISASINSFDDFIEFLKNRSELDAIVSEDAGWRYIKMTINTADEKAANAYEKFVSEIEPLLSEKSNALNRKTDEFYKKFEIEFDGSKVYFRGLKNELELFRAENITVFTEISKETQRYASIAGGLHIEYNGETYTLPRAALYLKDNNREVRKDVYLRMCKARYEKSEELNLLFDNLLKFRSQVSKNAGFDNYRDYKFKELARFDYSVTDCENLHNGIKDAIVPLTYLFLNERKDKLKLEHLFPYDLDAEIYGNTALKPFADSTELVAKTKAVFEKLDPYFADCIETMDKLGHFDLDSKKGKAPGGYNYPLYETGIPFIFMNSVGTQRDMVTMMHEGGHAIHSCITRQLMLCAFKSTPSEVAELASMSMELISMDYWNIFYSDEKELIRAKKEQLEKVISTLPWIAIVDKFQHWLYTNPLHTHAQRNLEWQKINKEFSTGLISYEGIEWVKEHNWQRQLHIFEVPFYYIEYAMAQLGAIAVWRNYKLNPQKTIEEYKKALSLGSTVTIPEVYFAAGIKFDFSSSYIKELAQFVKSEYDKLIL